uniref:Uncharacterized protein n=1 Tax=Glossina brevipalpis TaxID=37001 RepID=A0A1A9WF77_9MUSC
MPEVLLTVPSLELQSEESSEVETTSTSAEATARSSSSNDCSSEDLTSTSSKEKKQQNSLALQSKGKLRKAFGSRSQWKSSPKINSQQKVAGAFKVKSHIPRLLLLTPSSSSTSHATSGSVSTRALVPIQNSSAADLLTLTSVEKALIYVQRQKTSALLFCQRKSISQMDFKHARRNMSETMAMHRNSSIGNPNNMICKRLTCATEMMSLDKLDPFIHKIYKSDRSYYLPQPDPRMAGLRIYTAIMLNAWRKRRNEVKRLGKEVNDLKTVAMKSKNQLHVFNTLFRVEMRRNDELNAHLKRSLEDIKITKSSCEGLTTSLISLKADRAFLKQQLQIKDEEYVSLNTLQSRTKADLSKAVACQRDAQTNLALEQRKVQTLENQMNELINEIYELNSEATEKHALLEAQIEERECESEALNEYIKKLEEQIKVLKECEETHLSTQLNIEEQMEKEIESLNLEIESMQNAIIKKTFISRLKDYWRRSLRYQRTTLQMLHIVAFILLPATPPPRLSTFPLPSFNLSKALNIIKR